MDCAAFLLRNEMRDEITKYFCLFIYYILLPLSWRLGNEATCSDHIDTVQPHFLVL